jgi:tetratricopeptide (TPR) repeat protein
MLEAEALPTNDRSQLFADGKFPQIAKELQALGDPKTLEPSDKADLALAWCYLQREEEAAELLKDTPFDNVQAHTLLARYFAGRQEMVGRLKIVDKPGAAWAKRYQNHPCFKAECRLSAVMIVKNEAVHIERCIKSLHGIVDEIVLVDTGSTDGTVELAKKAAGDIKLILGNFPWIDDFSAARNASLDLATGDWALCIDADEELTEGSEGEIRQALIRPYFGGFHIKVVNYTGDEGDSSTFIHNPLRLFRLLPTTRFTGRIHEQTTDSILASGLPMGNFRSATLLHYGYRPSEMALKNKSARFISMLEREVRDNPNDAFQWFNLANAYTVYGRMPEAEHASRAAIKVAAPDEMVLPLSYTLLAAALTQQSRQPEALAVLDEAAERGIVSIFTEFERATALMQLERLPEALTVIDRSMGFEWPQIATGDYTVFSFKRHVVRGQVLALLGRPDEAIEMFDYALGVRPGFPNAIYLKATTLAALGRFAEALPLYQQVVEEPSLRALALQGIGRAYMSEEKFSDAAKVFEEAWKLDPSNYDAWSAWASACEEAKDLDTVVRAYSAFAQQNEPSGEILINWGRALDRAGQHQRALECFSEALQRSPEDPNAYFNCGDLLYRFGHYQDAAFLFETGLRLNPDHAPGWFVLGNSLAHLGFVDIARNSFERALVADPHYTEAKHNLDVLSEPISA